jgi:hypothetical protein
VPHCGRAGADDANNRGHLDPPPGSEKGVKTERTRRAKGVRKE